MYLQVQFASGHCHAAHAADPSLPEWPPHPSRLYSALVASAYHSNSGIDDAQRAALQWFEALPPPVISCPQADVRPLPVSYVPPGDSVERKGKKKEVVYEHGVHRWRQPRHFPSAVVLGDPTVIYQWENEPAQRILATLDGLAAGITHVGTSHAMALVCARAGKRVGHATFVPDADGNVFLRVPSPGRLDELDHLFANQSGPRRPAPACEQLAAYHAGGQTKRNVIQSDHDFFVLRLTGSMHTADAAAYLAKAFRAAIMSILGDKAPDAVHGHGEDAHVGWLPLPDVGHPRANGVISGIAVAIPRRLRAAARRLILSAINRLRRLRLPDGRVAIISSLSPAERLPAALDSATWIRSSAAWSTVTPVVLDRPPKKSTAARLNDAMAQSIRFAGYPAPVEIEISAYGLFRGSPAAYRLPGKKPRYHATVRFDRPIMGPVIAGRLRFFGIGLFRPVPSPESDPRGADDL